MALYGARKQEVIGRFKLHEKDTGSAEVQVALLSEKINDLSKHFELHKKDHGSRHGLIKMVGKRRRLLNYLKDQNQEKYFQLIEQLGIRK